MNYDGPAMADRIFKLEREKDALAAENERLVEDNRGLSAAWKNSCERGDAAVAKLAEARRLLERFIDGVEQKEMPNFMRAIVAFLAPNKGDAAHD